MGTCAVGLTNLTARKGIRATATAKQPRRLQSPEKPPRGHGAAAKEACAIGAATTLYSGTALCSLCPVPPGVLADPETLRGGWRGTALAAACLCAVSRRPLRRAIQLGSSQSNSRPMEHAYGSPDTRRMIDILKRQRIRTCTDDGDWRAQSTSPPAAQKVGRPHPRCPRRRTARPLSSWIGQAARLTHFAN